jgi:hypothetical protein
MDVKEWVDRVDGEGRFAVFESDDPIAAQRDLSIGTPPLRSRLHPVVDTGDAIPAQQEAIELRDSVS